MNSNLLIGAYRVNGTTVLIEASKAMNSDTLVARVPGRKKNIGFAFVNADQTIRWFTSGERERYAAESAALETLVAMSHDERMDAGCEYGKETGRCFICGRELSNEISKALSVGPICAAKYGIRHELAATGDALAA